MDTAVISALLKPEAWPHPVASLELIETHISWVLLTGEYAYKIKKPVDFGFLDFSTLEKRKRYCEEEVRLNGRLASEIYLDVVPICGSPKAPVIGGEGPALEYAVRMRQFDTRLGFDQLLQRGKLTGDYMDRVAAVLAEFHAGIEVFDENSSYGNPAVVLAPVRENFEQIRQNLSDQVDDPLRLEEFEALSRWSEAAWRDLEIVFSRRREAGFVRECHGDLHLRNIVLWQGRVTPFDCIEFNPSLRRIDVMSELAFLLMDLDDHGRHDLSARLLNSYLEHTGDYEGLQVLRFYQVYRALVRAKVASLRLAQAPQDLANERVELCKYLDLASRYTRPLTPSLSIVHGLSGSGKTYVSQQLLERSELIRLRSDVERKRLFGLEPLDSSESGSRPDIYTSEATERTYGRLLELARDVTGWGYAVLVDAAFLKAPERRAFSDMAREANIPFAILHCEADKALLRERIVERQARADDASEADLSVLELQIESQEPLLAEELKYCYRLDTTGELALSTVLDFLGVSK
jgi:aminoglycoside phosphotransferase family enzyme/predicted kinase